MKEIEIEMPKKIYEKAVKLAEKLNLSFDELCERGVRRLAEEHLKKDEEKELIK